MEEIYKNKQNITWKNDKRVQGKGIKYIKILLKKCMSVQDFSARKILKSFKKLTMIPSDLVDNLYTEIQNEKLSNIEIESARKDITESTYRTFKELLCPVC